MTKFANLLSFLTHISKNVHWDQASMVSATASKAGGGQFKDLHAIIVFFCHFLYLLKIFTFWLETSALIQHGLVTKDFGPRICTTRASSF